MKKVIFFWICASFLMIHNQTIAQLHFLQFNKKETVKICNKIEAGKTAEASKLLSKIPKPVYTDKNLKLFIAYNFLQFTLQKNFNKVEAQNALDRLSFISKLFEPMSQKGFLKKNTKKKLVKDCPLIDIDGECFIELEKYLRNSLNDSNKLAQVVVDTTSKNCFAVQDSFIINKDSIIKEANQSKQLKNEAKQARLMLQDNLQKSTTKSAMLDLKVKKSKALLDSVSVNFVVTNVDSIKLEVYLISKNPNGIIMNEYGVAEYCNEKVNAMIEFGVFDIVRRWFSILKGDTLNLSVSIIGEADDTWANKDQLQVFRNDKYGIGAQLNLKNGDGITNDTIARLRALSAKTFLNTGINKTESYIKENYSERKNVFVDVKSVVLYSKDWMKDKTENKGPAFRKETIILKCNNCK